MLIKLRKKIFSGALYLGKILYHNNDSKVLYYHDVHNDIDTPETLMSTPLSLFSNHIEVIKERGFEIVDRITKPENQIMLTFDDGFSGIYKNKNFFIDRGLKPTIFLITNSIGSPSFLNTDQILSLQEDGFRFQSHTHTHSELVTLNSKELAEEFNKSKMLLEALLLNDITEICFPKGLFNNKVRESALQSGYKYLFSSIPGKYFQKNTDPIIRRNLVQHVNTSELISILHGGSYIFRKRYSKMHMRE